MVIGFLATPPQPNVISMPLNCLFHDDNSSLGRGSRAYQESSIGNKNYTHCRFEGPVVHDGREEREQPAVKPNDIACLFCQWSFALTVTETLTGVTKQHLSLSAVREN